MILSRAPCTITFTLGIFLQIPKVPASLSGFTVSLTGFTGSLPGLPAFLPKLSASYFRHPFDLPELPVFLPWLQTSFSRFLTIVPGPAKYFWCVSVSYHVRNFTFTEVSFFNVQCLLMNTFIIIFTNPSARAGYDTRSIFKLSLTGLNSGFFFS